MHPLPYDALFFDADGTLRECTVPGQPCPNKTGEWRLKENVRETLALYDWDKVGLSVISNQGGVGLGYLTEVMAYQLIADMVIEATGRFPRELSLFICTHAPAEECECRKPKPKMLLDAEMFWHSRGVLHAPHTCLYVGDWKTDQEAAEAADIDFMWAKDFFGWAEE